MTDQSDYVNDGSRGIVLNGISQRGEGRLARGLVLLAIVLSVFVSIRFVSLSPYSSLALRLAGATFMIIGTVSLLLSRRWSYFVLGINIFSISLERVAFHNSFFVIPFLFAFVAFAIKAPQRDIFLAAGASFLVFTATAFFVANFHLAPFGLGALLGEIPIVLPIAALSLWIGTNTKYLAELKARSEISERESELLAQRAVAEERVRIARDLHDIVAHHVSLMVVQIGGVSASIRAREAAAAGQLDQVGNLGREAMGEMRRLLSLLRQESDVVVPVTPSPTISDLASLVSRTNEAGAEIGLSILGQRIDLPEALETTIFRICQESVTNIIKHGSSAKGTLKIEYGSEGVKISALNDFNPDVQVGSNGRGLQGVRERAMLFGGVVESDDRFGRFTLTVELPYKAEVKR
ncbi:MAG: histidine kinase [Actinomycetota bacterium]|nr:histidine kinase [Actinomycetota bacterium]